MLSKRDLEVTSSSDPFCFLGNVASVMTPELSSKLLKLPKAQKQLFCDVRQSWKDEKFRRMVFRYLVHQKLFRDQMSQMTYSAVRQKQEDNYEKVRKKTLLQFSDIEESMWHRLTCYHNVFVLIFAVLRTRNRVKTTVIAVAGLCVDGAPLLGGGRCGHINAAIMQTIYHVVSSKLFYKLSDGPSGLHNNANIEMETKPCDGEDSHSSTAVPLETARSDSEIRESTDLEIHGTAKLTDQNNLITSVVPTESCNNVKDHIYDPGDAHFEFDPGWCDDTAFLQNETTMSLAPCDNYGSTNDSTELSLAGCFDDLAWCQTASGESLLT